MRTGFALDVAATPSGLADPETAARLAEQAARIRPAEAFRMDALQPAEDEWDRSGLDAVLALADSAGLPVHGTLLGAEHLPTWLAGRSWSRRELAHAFYRHIHELAGAYRGRIASWTVAPEPLTGTGRLRRSIWRGLGPDYLAVAFRRAHDADGSARLHGVAGENPAKTEGFYRLVRHLVGRGVPIHGVGVQVRLVIERALDGTPAVRAWTGTGPGIPWSADLLETHLTRLGRLGLDVAVTELNVRLPAAPGPADRARQAQVHAEVLRIAAGLPPFRSLTVTEAAVLGQSPESPYQAMRAAVTPVAGADNETLDAIAAAAAGAVRELQPSAQEASELGADGALDLFALVGQIGEFAAAVAAIHRPVTYSNVVEAVLAGHGYVELARALLADAASWSQGGASPPPATQVRQVQDGLVAVLEPTPACGTR